MRVSRIKRLSRPDIKWGFWKCNRRVRGPAGEGHSGALIAPKSRRDHYGHIVIPILRVVSFSNRRANRIA